MAFTDGCSARSSTATYLRPGRWLVTDDGWVALASEVAFAVDDSKVVRRGRLRPGRLFMVDVEKGKLWARRELELELARRRPYRKFPDTHVEFGPVHWEPPSGERLPPAAARASATRRGTLLGADGDRAKEPAGRARTFPRGAL